MAPPLPEATRLAIQLAIQLAHDNNQKPDFKAIAAVFFTSLSAVYHARKRIVRNAEPGYAPKRAGPKPAIKSADEEEVIAKAIREFIEQNVNVHQDVISDWVHERFGVKLSQSSWSRFIQRHGIPHKTSNRFWPKSKLVQTRGQARKKSKGTKGVEEGGVVFGTEMVEHSSGGGKQDQSLDPQEGVVASGERQSQLFGQRVGSSTSEEQQEQHRQQLSIENQPQIAHGRYSFTSDTQSIHSPNTYSNYPMLDPYTGQPVNPGRTWAPGFLPQT
jgi:transposase